MYRISKEYAQEWKKAHEWQMKLQEDYPFMWQENPNMQEENFRSYPDNVYRYWGCECSSGWYQILRDCCDAIIKRYAEDDIMPDDIDFIPLQIKEKFGTLRFYYEFRGAPSGIAAIDFLGDGQSIRFEAGIDDVDEKTQRLRHDISTIVRKAEKKSKTICELCGSGGASLRNDSEYGIHWVKTLCNSCHEKRIEKVLHYRGQ